MSGDLFVCDLCGHTDAIVLAYPQGENPVTIDPINPAWICTKCQTGKWHNRFEYKPYSAEFDLVVNRSTGIGLGS